MRKFLISATVAAAALTAAAPAAAQYAPPYGNAYGYGQNHFGHVRSLQVRVNRLQQQIRQLDRRNIITNREAARLMDDSRDLERRLRRNARDGYGLTPNEARAVEVRLVRLEQRLFRDARDGNRWGRNWSDRDRDGRNDRFEDDRGYRHD
jgi:opacity protein-like surface antigen